MKQTIEEIAREDGRYDVRAVKFVFDGLGSTIQEIRQGFEEDPGPRHITGEELARGLAGAAIERWGRLARMVLNHWGLRNTRDFGEIVYMMIDHGWMTAQETDTIEDFDDVFDFETVFEKQYDFEVKSE